MNPYELIASIPVNLITGEPRTTGYQLYLLHKADKCDPETCVMHQVEAKQA